MSEGVRKKAKARILDRCTAEQSELATLREQVKVLRDALRGVAEQRTSSEIRSGWGAGVEEFFSITKDDTLIVLARTALDQTKPKSSE